MMMDTALNQSDTSSVVRTWTTILCVALSYLVFAPLAFAQEDAETIDGKIQVKLTESAKAQFEGAEDGLPNVVPQGQTGIQSLDRMAQQFDIERMERVFRPAGKHESRHVEWGLDRWYNVHFQADVDPETVAQSYLESSMVEAGSPIYEKAKTGLDEMSDWGGEGDEENGASAGERPDEEPSYVPDDPEYSAQWHYDNTSDNPGTPDADIDLPEAHNIETGDSDVIISVVDGGLDLDHPEFQGMLWINDAEDINNNGQFDPYPASEGGDLNGVDDDNNGFTDDVIGYDHGGDDAVPSADGDHGTHVAGTVAAKNGNGQFGAGVAGGGNGDPGVRLMINQTFSTSTGGFGESVVYAADNGAVVSQNSWGYTSPGTFEQPVLDAIDYLRANAGGPNAPMDGGIYSNAAGNDNDDGEWYPGFYEPSFAVSATNEVDDKASYSNFGDWVDIAAPGGNGADCTTPAPSGAVHSTVQGGFGPLCGTSMAAPHVSGLIGLVVSHNPGLTNDQVEALLQNTGEDVGSSFQIGPRINAFNALTAGGADETPPAAIDDLSATNVSGNSVDLEWTAPGDDGDTSGVASYYDLRYSTDGPIDDSTSWANATEVDGEPTPDTLGTPQEMTVDGLPFGTTVHFSIRAIDDFGNTGAIGNSPSGDTDPAPVLAFNPDSLAAELESGQDTSVALTVTNDGAAESTLDYSFPDFAADALLAQPDVERNNTSSVIDDASYEKGNDPHAGIGHPVRTGAGGPDAFGYSWIDSNEPGGPSFAFNDISDVGTATGIGDLESIEVDLPFTFEYYGEPQSTVNINNNGFVFFEGALDGYFVNDEIPNTGDPNGVIAAFWDDLDPGSGGEVYTYYDESAGQFIVQWDEVPALFGNVPMTFQIILSEDGSIRYNILDIDEGDNDSATTGIENLTGEVGLQVAFNTPYPEDSLSVSIAATPDFITDVSPASGTLGGGESDEVDVTFSAEDIEPGTYTKDLGLTSNDPDNTTVGISSTLSVTSGPPAIALEPDSLDFGSVLVGNATTATFTIDNSGGGPLEVSSVSFPDDVFNPVDSADTGPFTVPFGEERDIEVEFAPTATGTFDGNIVVESDAANDPSAEVFVEGEGVPAPDIAVSPSAISDSLAPGDSSETTLTVTNSGGSALEFSTTIASGSTPSATAPSTVAAPSRTTGNGRSDAVAVRTDSYQGQTTDVGQTSTTYQLDDGTSENGLGFGGQGDDFHSMWLNAFQVVEGAGTVTEISTAWGCEACDGESLLPEGKEGTALIYSDPNNDGDPSDAELLTETTITVEDPGTNNFTSVSIEPTSVEGTFFVAVLLENVNADAFPMPMDESSTYQESSWAVATTLPASFDKENLSNNDVLSRMDNLGDGSLAANWLLRAEGGANFVAVEPSAGTVPEGGSLDLTATFDATGLDPGVFEASINFDSNDPDDSPSVDATLEVSAGPAVIALEPDSIDFGSLLVGDDTTGTFTISNTGGEPLEVSSVSFPDDVFSPVDSADTGPFTIPFEGSRDIEIRFAPDAPDVFSGDIVVESNADNNPSATVFVEGEGLPAPDVAFTPDTLETTLASGESEDLTLTLTNDGPAESTLEYTFPDFAADALLSRPGVERNDTSPHKQDGDYDRSAGQDNDPHAGTGHPVRTGAGGPDAFGYSWIDSNEPGGPSFAWNDISDEGTATGIGTEESVTVALPFTFDFYGEARDTVQISDNGYLNFGEEGDGTDFGNDPIPDTTPPNGAAFGFWEDLDPGEGNGEVYYYHDSSAGQFIVQYDQVEAWGFGEVPVFTFQIILSQDGTIRYNYLSMDTETDDDHASASIGVENPVGDVGLQVVSDAPYVEDSLSTVIAATPDFITDVSPASGTLGGGESEDVSVTFDAADIDPGMYETDLALATNDLDESNVGVPSKLTVSGGGGDCPLAWSLDVATTDESGFEETLTLGQGPNATAGLDADCGEVEQPPKPPEEESDFRFTDTDLTGVELGEGTLVDIRPDYEPTPEAQNAPAIWRVNLQSDDFPISMSWDNSVLDAATDRPVELVDAATGGDIVSVDMKNTGSASIENSAVSAVEVRLGQTTGHEFVLTSGWNFKSMPLMTSDMSFGAMMSPCHSAFAYTPGEGYSALEVGDIMEMGEGYWFNCTEATHTVTGTVPSPPTAEVGAGWNVVGPYADSVDVSSITSDPEGIVESAFFGFGQSSGYTAAETLAPAQAYWVKTSDSGTLTFSGSGGASATLAAKAATSAEGADRSETLRLAVTDAQGHEATVRLAEGLSKQKLQRSAMPPKPPSGAFDVRFESGRSVASFDADAEASDALETLELQGVSYPLTLRLENADEQGRSLRLERGSGQDAETRTLSAESPSVTLQSEAGPLKVAPRSVPDEFALNNSYPNPVSAQATIEYAVPEKAAVTVEVYDVLGRRVATLVNGKKEAGEYSVRLNANDLSSGTYFYRMRAGNFTKTRRMVVVR